MEDVYTIKVKSKPDTRNQYPSERRYSASTVSGLAWVHIALSATSFLLACLALVNPNSDITRLNINDTEQTVIQKPDSVFNLTGLSDLNVTDDFDGNQTLNEDVKDFNYVLVVSSTLLSVFALASGIASIMASSRWYVDRNITWLFIMSILSTIVALTSFILTAVWFVTESKGDIRDFYKNHDTYDDYFVIKHSDIVAKNGSHLIIKNNADSTDDTSKMFTKRVLCINILIACFLELLWSILSLKISYKGMRNNYKDDDEPRGNTVSIVTTVKGNNTKNIPRNKLIQPKSDLIPSNNVKRIFLAQNDNGFYLKNQNNKNKQTDTSSELYKERMINFLDRCADLEGMSEPEMNESEQNLNPIKEVSVEINESQDKPVERMTPVSWGDSPNHTIYNQNNLNLEKIFTFAGKENDKTEDES